MDMINVDGVDMKPSYQAFKATNETVALIKEYVRRTIDYDNKLSIIRAEMKEMKRDYESQGINVKAVNRALAYYKRQKKMTQEEKDEMEHLSELFASDPDLVAKIAATL